MKCDPLFKRLLLVCGGAVVGALLLEGGVRLFLPPPPIITVQTAAGADTSGAAQTLERSLNDRPNQIYLRTESGIRLRPNSHAIIENHATCGCRAELRTNSFGFRNRELEEKKRPRVLFLGDSITLADYMPEAETWVRQVETISESSEAPIETVNAGIWAVGLANEISLLVERGLQTEPDVVVIAFYLNDVENSPGIVSELPPVLSSSWAARHLYRLYRETAGEAAGTRLAAVSPEELQRWRQNTAARLQPNGEQPPSERDRLAKAVSDLFFDWGSAFSYEAWEAMRPLFAEFARLSKTEGFRPAIVIFPVADQVYFDEVFDFPQERLKEIAGSLGIPVLDLLPLLRGLHKQTGEKIFYDWCHPTPFAAGEIAPWIHDFLKESVLIAGR